MFDRDGIDRAKAIALRYESHPAPSVHRMFEAIRMVMDTDTITDIPEEDLSRDQRMMALSSSSPTLEVSFKDNDIVITSTNVKSVDINFYVCDDGNGGGDNGIE